MKSYTKVICHLSEAIEFCEDDVLRTHLYEAIHRATNLQIAHPTAHEMELMRTGRKLEAIRDLRNRLNISLKDAKDMLEEWEKK